MSAVEPAEHPAKYSAPIIERMAALIAPGSLVLDPFAGTGKLKEIKTIRAVTLEIEPEWAVHRSTSIIGDARDLPFANSTFDAICTSPTYGNRMADHHNAKDDSKRHTYTHYLGRKLAAGNTGSLQWGERYRVEHRVAWSEAIRVLKVGGYFYLNCSDHIRNGVQIPVTRWHAAELVNQGLVIQAAEKVLTRRQRHGANAHRRVDHEWIVIFRKPDPMMLSVP